MPNDILSIFFKGETTYDETIKNIEDFMIKKIEEEIKDCTTCDWRKFNDYWNMPFCYCTEECIDWDKWKEKINGERDSN